MPVRRPARPVAVADSHDEEEDTPVAAPSFKEPPVRRRGRPAPAPEVDEDEEEPPFVPDDDDVRTPASSVVRRGWEPTRESMDAAKGDYVNDFKWGEEAVLVKFLDDAPLTYNQHWLNGKDGKKSYVCLEDECPLCRNGHVPDPKAAFSIVGLVPEEEEWMLICSKKQFDLLEARAKDPRDGPLTKKYWALSASGDSRRRSYSIVPVKPRDLEEDWGITEDEALAIVENHEAADAEAINVTSLEELTEIAEQYFTTPARRRR